MSETLPSTPKVAPKTLRYRDFADLEKQLNMVRMNALAAALQNSCLMPLLRVPQSIPHKAGSVDYSGSKPAADYADNAAAIVENQRQWHECKWQDWEKAEKLDAEHTRLLARKTKLEDELAAYDYAPPARAGISGLYEVKVPSVLIINPLLGIGEGSRAAERWELDTRGLGGPLRAQLDAYLDSGTKAMPNRYREGLQRFERREYRNGEHRLFADLWARARRLDIQIVAPELASTP